MVHAEFVFFNGSLGPSPTSSYKATDHFLPRRVPGVVKRQASVP